MKTITAPHSRESVEVDGRERTFTSIVPPDLDPGAALLVVFHGSNQTGETVRRFAGGTLDELATRERIVVVYPDAYKRLWNDARVSSDFPARRDGYDDVAFFRALVAHFDDVIDTRRVFVVGYSNGGQLVNRLIHEAGELLAGAALLSATQPAPENFLSETPPSPLPILLMHGTRDRIVPYGGGMASLWGFRPRGLGLSHIETGDYFAAANGITARPHVTTLTPPRPHSMAVTVRDWAEAGKPPVRAYTIAGGGHVIPNPVKAAPFVLGATSRDLDAARVIWSFFTGERGR